MFKKLNLIIVKGYGLLTMLYCNYFDMKKYKRKQSSLLIKNYDIDHCNKIHLKVNFFLYLDFQKPEDSSPEMPLTQLSKTKERSVLYVSIFKIY